jgi:hypothetical protein
MRRTERGLVIQQGSARYTPKNDEEFWTMYYTFLRLGKDAEGMSKGRIVFRINLGVEMEDEQKARFAVKTSEWKPPTKVEIQGALNQFKNLSELARDMGVSRNIVSRWKDKGVISFHAWRYLCEYLGIHRTVSHKLKYREPTWMQKGI